MFCRKMHDGLVAKQKRKKALEKDNNTVEKVKNILDNYTCVCVCVCVFVQRGKTVAEIATEDDLKHFQTPHVTGAAAAAGELRMRLKRDEEHYIPHIPSDYHAEKGLSVVGGGFNREAASLTLDLDGDEGEGGKAQKEKMKW